MKAGTKVTVNFSYAKEQAVVIKATPVMRPVPAGYVPVRFKDRGVLMIHESNISRSN